MKLNGSRQKLPGECRGEGREGTVPSIWPEEHQLQRAAGRAANANTRGEKTPGRHGPSLQNCDRKGQG